MCCNSPRRISTLREELPESIHTSSVSLDLATASAPVQFAGFTSDQSSAADFSNHTLEPCCSMSLATLQMISFVKNRLAVCVVKRGQWHAPTALAADAPIGTRLHGAFDAVDAPVGNPRHAVNLGEGEFEMFGKRMLLACRFLRRADNRVHLTFQNWLNENPARRRIPHARRVRSTERGQF